MTPGAKTGIKKPFRREDVLMKDTLITFHETAHGYRHIQENIPCQDRSLSCSSEEGDYQIICVADGHGDPACHRSDDGAGFAVEAAKKCLKDFAEAIISGNMPFTSPRQRSECLEQLTNSILSKWYGKVRNDLLAHAVTEADLAAAGRYEEAYRKGDRVEHLYGTTLIAALWVQDYLVLIQQGDGRCDVFYTDGAVDQPIPWDERCKGSTTTSMCDKDAFNRIRTAVIDLTQKDVAACFLGSDGVEDSYYDNEESQLGTHRFYMDLSCKLCEYGADQFKNNLKGMLSAFSKTGSGDDVSVAGIVDLDKISKLIDFYKEAVEQYDIHVKRKVDYEEARSKVISMTRKHGILSTRVSDAEAALLDAHKDRRSRAEELHNLTARREQLSCQAGQDNAELDGYRQDSQTITDLVKGKFPRFEAAIQQFLREIFTGCSAKEAAYEALREQLRELDGRISELKEAQNAGEEAIEQLKAKLAEAQAEFAEYDAKYRAVEAEAARLENELAVLRGRTRN